MYGIQVLCLHLAEPTRRCEVRYVIPAGLVRRFAVGWAGAEPNLVELHPVQGAVVVPTGANGTGQHDAAGVDGLPRALEVDSPRNLLDEDRREPLTTELLVDAEEVYFGTLKHVVADPHLGGDGRNEGTECVTTADTYVPLFPPAW